MPARESSMTERRQKLLGWLVTPAVALAVLGALLVSQFNLMVALRLGCRPYKAALDFGYWMVLCALRLSGASYRIPGKLNLPRDRSLIIVANHQSLLDIPLLGWVFRAHNPKFIAKAELGRGIPGVSHALRHMGSVLINRAEGKAAVSAIQKFAGQVEAKKYSAVIFPEGTRSRDGVLREFKPAGFITLLRNMPSALVVPVAIANSWKLMRWKGRPIPFGTSISMQILNPVERAGRAEEEILALVQKRINQALQAAAG